MTTWYERPTLPLLLAVGAWLAKGQADLLLSEVQQTGTTSYGPSDLGGFTLTGPRAAVNLWHATGTLEGQTSAFLVAHTAFVLLTTFALCWFVLALLKWLRGLDGVHAWSGGGIASWYGPDGSGPRPLTWLVLLVAGQQAAHLVAYFTHANRFAVWAGGVASYLIDLDGGLLLLLVVAVVRNATTQPGEEPGPPRVVRASVASDLSSLGSAAGTLRGQIGLGLVFALLLLVDLTGQVSDLLRKWWDAPLTWLPGLVAVCVLALLLWASCRRIILGLQGTAAAAPAARGLGVVFILSAVTAVVAAVWFGSWVPLALPTVVLLLVALQVVCVVTGWQVTVDGPARAGEARSQAHTKSDDLVGALKYVARVTALTPVVAVGLALVRAGAGPLVLWLASAPGAQVKSVLVVVAGFALIALAPLWGWGLIAGWDAGSTPAAFEPRYGLLIAVVAALVIVLIHDPLSSAPVVGSIAVVAIGLSAIAVVFAELQRLAEHYPPPRGLTMLGFRRLPVFVLLATWFALAGIFSGATGQHPVRTLAGKKPQSVSLGSLWSDWLTANCVEASSKPVPLVLVATEGGGIRAAYWTAEVLTKLAPPTATVSDCPGASSRNRIFAISGISGGSVGAASYLAQDTLPAKWYETDLGNPDSAAVPLAVGLLEDLPRAVLGFASDDRAAYLEQSWQQRVPNLDQNYFVKLKPGSSPDHEQSWMPVTLFGGSQVETGCRVNTSSLRLTATSPGSSNDCRDDVARAVAVDVNDSRAGRLLEPAAPLTLDSITLAQKCKVSFRISTAALLSARWPYISPSGALPCSDSVNVVDGGYADGDGRAAVLELWAQLEPLVATYNASHPQHLVVPVFTLIDNHYQSLSKAPPPSGVSQLFVPPKTWLSARSARDEDRAQAILSALNSGVPGDPTQSCVIHSMLAGHGEVLLAPRTSPGLPAPLAWTLSQSSRSDLDTQLGTLFDAKEKTDLPDGLSLTQTMTGSGSAFVCQPVGS